MRPLGTPRSNTRLLWRRRLVALAVLVAVPLLGVIVALGASRGEDGSPRAEAGVAGAAGAGERAAQPKPPPPPELPRGGRTILPDFRVVALYGAPQAPQLGELGIGSPATAARKLERQAKPYARKSRPVLPAMELIAVIANGSAGPDGKYRTRQKDGTVRRYLRAARKAKALLLLDIQPGHSDFLTEARHLRKWLKEPDVGLALDPEWRMTGGQVPGTVIGSVSAKEVNATSAWLDQLTARYDLPQKLFLIHQFTDSMVPVPQLKRRRHLANVMNVDGFGGQEIKIEKYRAFARTAKKFRHGFKLFYEEDRRGGSQLMTPKQVMALRPRPDVVIYE